MAMATEARLTYQEYLDSPETLCRFEIVDGVVVMAAGPTPLHQRIAGNIYRPAHYFISERGLGGIWFAPLDVVVRQEPLRVRQPDLLYVSAGNWGVLTARVEGGPDWVVEILSPGNGRGAMDGRLADYARVGVRECWLVSPEAHTVEVLTLEGGGWQRVSIRGVGERVEPVVLAGLELAVGAIFRGA